MFDRWTASKTRKSTHTCWDVKTANSEKPTCFMAVRFQPQNFFWLFLSVLTVSWPIMWHRAQTQANINFLFHLLSVKEGRRTQMEPSSWVCCESNMIENQPKYKMKNNDKLYRCDLKKNPVTLESCPLILFNLSEQQLRRCSVSSFIAGLTF